MDMERARRSFDLRAYSRRVASEKPQLGTAGQQLREGIAFDQIFPRQSVLEHERSQGARVSQDVTDPDDARNGRAGKTVSGC